jgi:hypothetical protein
MSALDSSISWFTMQTIYGNWGEENIFFTNAEVTPPRTQILFYANYIDITLPPTQIILRHQYRYYSATNTDITSPPTQLFTLLETKILLHRKQRSTDTNIYITCTSPCTNSTVYLHLQDRYYSVNTSHPLAKHITRPATQLLQCTNTYVIPSPTQIYSTKLNKRPFLMYCKLPTIRLSDAKAVSAYLLQYAWLKEQKQKGLDLPLILGNMDSSVETGFPR